LTNKSRRQLSMQHSLAWVASGKLVVPMSS